MPRAAIALGSNLGSRLARLQEAREMLRHISSPGEPFLSAPVYQTAPVGCPPHSPDFYNTVVEFSFDGPPFDLLSRTQEIEAKLGRAANPERNAPRVIDVDILYLGDHRINAGHLVLPHPRLTSRLFVLKPLSDIRPSLILPGDQTTILGHLHHINSAEPPPTLVHHSW